MKALDFVKTPKGGIAIIKEKSLSSNYTDKKERATYSIIYLNGCNPGNEHNAWWQEHELSLIDSLPQILARNLIHPFGNNKQTAINSFPLNI